MTFSSMPVGLFWVQGLGGGVHCVAGAEFDVTRLVVVNSLNNFCAQA